MIESLKTTCPLVCGKVAGIFNNHNRAFVPGRIFADGTDFLVCQVLTHLAECHMFLGAADRIRKTVHTGR